MALHDILVECTNRNVILTLINEVAGRDGLKYGAVFGTVSAVHSDHVQIAGTLFIEIDTIFSVEVTDTCPEAGLEVGWDEDLVEYRYYQTAPRIYNVENPNDSE